jgi:hypothetical protein
MAKFMLEQPNLLTVNELLDSIEIFGENNIDFSVLLEDNNTISELVRCSGQETRDVIK